MAPRTSRVGREKGVRGGGEVSEVLTFVVVYEFPPCAGEEKGRRLMMPGG